MCHKMLKKPSKLIFALAFECVPLVLSAAKFLPFVPL